VAPPAPPVATDPVTSIADAYYEAYIDRFPTAPYFAGLPTDAHDRLLDNSPDALAAWWAHEDALYARLMRVDRRVLVGTTDWVTHGLLQEELEASIGLRVCRNDLWDVNHMWGWQLGMPRVAAMQPVETADQRSQALARWDSLPAFIDQEVDNLRQGLTRGYSAPKAVVQRVIAQVNRMIALETAESPFMDPARRVDDAEFEAELSQIVSERIAPALLRYRDFLLDEYLAAARDAIAVSANPDGRACYEASLRNYTTLPRSPEAVFELGQRTVNANREQVIELGEARYGSSDFAEIVRLARDDPDEVFGSADELLAYAQAAAERSQAGVADWFAELPQRALIVEPYPPYQDGTGVSDRYESGDGDRPGIYRIVLASWVSRQRGNAEVTAFHEGYPGHHLQIAISQELTDPHPLTQLVFNSGFGEGWARYSEDLAEVAGMYTSPTAPILRRAWPARGMVVDPGIHVMGWTREEAKAFMIEAGRFAPERADDMVDRIAILPGQLTAYDSGALEMWALRDQAREVLGEAFDIRAFHTELLRNGTVPLPLLREHIERWIESQH
jgi:uncharacterized protein (DUF885 family)